MSEMGLFWEAEAYYNRAQLVFNNRSVEVSIDPRGETGGYDVNVSAQVSAMDTDPAFEPIDITIPSMKGVLQFVNDKVFSSTGMVGEPEAQTELPLENKVRITKSELQQIIKEELLKEAGRPHSMRSGSMADLDAEAKMRETDFLKSAQGVTDADVREQAIMMVSDILDIVDTESESGQLILRLHQLLQGG